MTASATIPSNQRFHEYKSESRSTFSRRRSAFQDRLPAPSEDDRGGVLGLKEFVDRVFGMNRGHFPATRKDGARRMRGGVDWGEMRSLRDLQQESCS